MKKLLRILRKTLVVIVCVALVLSLGTWLLFQYPSFGKAPTADRLERIKKSPNYRDGKFQNLSETPMRPPGVSIWKISTCMITERDEYCTPKYAIPTLTTNLKSPAGPKPVATWFGHSTVLLQVNGINILTDPMFSQRASPVQFAGPKAFEGTKVCIVGDLPPIDIVLISHNHYDHLDYHTILLLKDQVKAFYVPLGVGAHLESWGVDKRKIHEHDWWEESEFDSTLKIVLTPSRHFSGRGPNFNTTLWGSYVIMSGGYRFFYSGDTGYDTHFKKIGSKYGPFDLVFIETGQYSQYWPNIHMQPEQGVQAAADLGAKVLMPVHWSKFALSLHAWDEPVKRSFKKADLITSRSSSIISLPACTFPASS